MNLFKEKIYKKEDMEKYLKKVNIPKIPEYINKILNEPVQKEVEKAIDNMKNGKSPGPDRITSTFYKVLKKRLAVNCNT